jgi:hypothetical protein
MTAICTSEKMGHTVAWRSLDGGRSLTMRSSVRTGDRARTFRQPTSTREPLKSDGSIVRIRPCNVSSTNDISRRVMSFRADRPTPSARKPDSGIAKQTQSCHSGRRRERVRRAGITRTNPRAIGARGEIAKRTQRGQSLRVEIAKRTQMARRFRGPGPGRPTQK